MYAPLDSDLDGRARIPADIDAPDKLMFGLTARQVAILAAAAAAGYLIWQTLSTRLPLPALAAILAPLGGAAAVLALGRRDGLPLDGWAVAALRYRRAARRAVPAPGGLAEPPAWAAAWAEPPAGTDRARPAALRLPARAIGEDGIVDLGGCAASLVAATTVNIGLRTPAEQAALVAAYGRWLNSLAGPAQVVVSAQRVDLSGHAARVAAAAQALPDAALADAAADYAEFLLDLAEARDPLWRTVTVVCATPARHAGAGHDGEHAARAEAARRAEHTAAAWSAFGAQTRVLDGPTVTAVLACTVDPYQPTDASWPRATAHTPVTTAESDRSGR